MPHYNTYSFFLKKKFGSPVKKVPVNAGFSCPNRDGTKSSAGCAFCDNRVFSPVAAVSTPPIEQLASAMRRAGNRYTKFLAYLQPYSNTFGTIEKIRDVCESLIAVPGVVGICIGTRPDCISDDAFEYLAGLARRTYVSVELGLQSSHDRTLSLVNRGHTFDEFAAAARRLHSLGIEPVAHVMLGLPGETDDMMFETADRLAVLPVDGVKLHQVMIIRGTLFETWFSEGKLSALTIGEYARLAAGFIERLRPEQHIHRIMADTHYGLVAPEWSGRKRESLAFLQELFKKHGTVQGSRRKVIQ